MRKSFFVRGLGGGGGHWPKILSFTIVLFVSGNIVLAAPPATPYGLGETLSPACAPGALNCTVTSPQEHHTYLDDISAVSVSTGDMLYFDGTNWIGLAAGAAGEALLMGIGGTPSWGAAATNVWQEVASILSPVNAAVYRATITNNSNSTLTGFQAINTNDVHNYAGAVFEAKGSGPDYTNNLYYGKYSDNYYVPSWAGNGVMATDQDLFITSAGSTDLTNPNPDPQIGFQVGGGYTAPVTRMTLNTSGLAFTSGARVNSFLDEDNFISNSATALATQQSIKAYVDSHVGTSIQDADTDTSVRVESAPDEDTIHFNTAGSERMFLDSTGSLGLGVDAPLINTLQIGPGAHESGMFSVAGDGVHKNIANFRDENGESIFLSKGNLVADNLQVTFGDYEDAYSAPYFGVFANDDHYNFARGEVRFLTSMRNRYVGFISPLTVLASVIWTLPDADGTSGQVLTTNGGGVLSWSDKAADLWSKVGSVIRPAIATDGLAVGTAGDATATYLQIDAGGWAPPAGDCDDDTERGRMFVDYSVNNRFYVCNGAARGWDYVDLQD